MEKEETFKRFKNDAKSIVDALHDNGIFRNDISRDDMNVLENLIQFYMESSFNLHLKSRDISERIKKHDSL